MRRGPVGGPQDAGAFVFRASCTTVKSGDQAATSNRASAHDMPSSRLDDSMHARVTRPGRFSKRLLTSSLDRTSSLLFLGQRLEQLVLHHFAFSL